LRSLALLLAALAPLAASAEDPKPAEWKGTVGAGLIVLTGNSDTTTFTGGAAASRETLGWIMSTKAAGAYGRTRQPGGGAAATTTALNGAFQLRLDRKLGEIWTVYALGGLEFDHVAAVEYRTLAELGGSAQWIDVKEADWQKVALRVDLGLRYGYEARRAYYGTALGALPGAELVAPRLGLAFRYGFSKEVFFTEEAEVLPTVSDSGRVLAKSVSKLSSRLGAAVTLGVGYTVVHDTRPAEGKEKTDTALAALLEVGF